MDDLYAAWFQQFDLVVEVAPWLGCVRGRGRDDQDAVAAGGEVGVGEGTDATVHVAVPVDADRRPDARDCAAGSNRIGQRDP